MKQKLQQPQQQQPTNDGKKKEISHRRWAGEHRESVPHETPDSVRAGCARDASYTVRHIILIIIIIIKSCRR